MINERQGGEVCRSPTSPPSKDSLRIGPGRAPPRILRGTRPGCSAAAAAASEHSGLLAPVGPLRSAFRPPARRRSGAAPAACGGTSGPRRSPSRPAWLGLSAPALARRSGGSRPPSAALRVGLRPGPARGLWRGFAPLSQAPGPAAGGVGSPLRRRGCLAAAGRLRRWYTKRRYAQGPPRRARHTCEPLRSRISSLTELVSQGIQQSNLWPVVL